MPLRYPSPELNWFAAYQTHAKAYLTEVPFTSPLDLANKN